MAQQSDNSTPRGGEPEPAAAAGALKDPIVLGRISGLYGVRGWVRVVSYTEPREALFDYRTWWLQQDGAWRAMALEEGRRQGKSLVARLGDVEDRDVATEWLGADIAVPRQDLPDAGPGEYYWADLEGLQVRHRDGRVLGHVSYMLATGANDVMVVKAGDDENREILVPFVPDIYILAVDLPGGVVEVDWEWD